MKIPRATAIARAGAIEHADLHESHPLPAMNIEPLENRIAPAATFTFIDLDGDVATITTSKGTIADLSEANGVLTFSAADPGEPDVPRQLRKIDLGADEALASIFAFTDLTVKVIRKAPGGDGLVHVGYIDAREQITGGADGSADLGAVSVSGDLGRIQAGSEFQQGAPSVRSLSVGSLGLYGLATQGGTGDLLSIITGPVGSLKVRGDVREAAFVVQDDLSVKGTIGSVTVGGSLIGGDGPDTGVIQADGAIGAIKIGGDIRSVDSSPGSTLSGFSGAVISLDGRIASLTVGGSILGGKGLLAGAVSADSFGPVKIAGDFSGTLGGLNPPVQSLSIGGSMTGGIFTAGAMQSLRVTGDVAGMLSGSVPVISVGGSVLTGGRVGGGSSVQIGGDIDGGTVSGGSVTVGGSLIGNTADDSGRISGFTVNIRGDVIGGDGLKSGRVEVSGARGSVTIGGSLIGGDGESSGTLFGLTGIGSVKIGRSLIGGLGVGSAQIEAGSRDPMVTEKGELGPVTVGGSVLGRALQSAFIRATGTIGPVKIVGSLVGGAGAESGRILAGEGLGPVTVGRDVRGGGGQASGLIESLGAITSVTIGGSLTGGTGNFTGAVTAADDLGPVKIKRNLRGGSITGTAPDADSSGFIRGDRITSVDIGGSILAGLDTSTAGTLVNNASIRADFDLGPITVKGSIAGTSASEGVTRPLISARGQETLAPGATVDLAIKSLTVGGRVDGALIVAGFQAGFPIVSGQNGNASIGAVRVGGDWIASSLAAGVNDTNGNGFGNDDQRIAGATLVARIASITIKGTVAGTAAGSDHFGFTAAEIGAFRASGFIAQLTAQKETIPLSLITADVALREV